MEDGPSKFTTTTTTTTATTTIHNPPLPLHTLEPLRRTTINRLFAVVYTCAILALFYHHALTLLHSTTLLSFSVSLSLLIADIIFALMWVCVQSFRLRPIRRKQFVENLEKVEKRSDFPAMDIFVCTADPYKEPPVNVVNTAISVMAYDYPTEKISVYVSDDGGSELTLFAFMEGAKFASHWLPFCREKKIVERCPEAYFRSNHSWCSETEKIKMMYESMKVRVENVVVRGKVGDEYVTCEQGREAFSKWTDKFTRHDHPNVIQLRVSATMTNAPIILTLDCDMYSNDPQTLQRALCYLSDPVMPPNFGFIQFPQRFQGINKNDIYACEHKRPFQINPMGVDGLMGPSYVGTGCFFRRRVFFGGPSSLVSPDIPELSPDYTVEKSIQSQPVLALAHHVAGCNYEKQTKWGSKMGFRYGSLVEDYYTSFWLHCEGWNSVFCDPDRAAFLGVAPINLIDALNQNKRWCVGLFEVGFSKYSPITFGIRSRGLLVALYYAVYAFWAIWSIPITIYAFLPQLALLAKMSLFPKVSDPWLLLYVFLVLGSYGQDLLDFILAGGTVQRWWSDQRMWAFRGLSSFFFGTLEFSLKSIGISMQGFNVTSKVVDDEQSKRYEQGLFEFGVPSPMFVPPTMAAIINLASFVVGCMDVFGGGIDVDGLFVQMVIAGYAVVNCWPIYEAMILRSDRGKMSTKTTVVSIFLSWALYKIASLALK